MIVANPSASDILCNSTVAAGTVVTIPANRTYTCDISITTTQTVAGSSTATLTFNPKAGSTGTGPDSATVVLRCTATGLASSVGTNNTYITAVYNGGSAGATLDFALGGATSASCSISGFLI